MAVFYKNKCVLTIQSTYYSRGHLSQRNKTAFIENSIHKCLQQLHELWPNWKQPKCSSQGNKLWHMYCMEYYSLKKGTISTCDYFGRSHGNYDAWRKKPSQEAIYWVIPFTEQVWNDKMIGITRGYGRRKGGRWLWL